MNMKDAEKTESVMLGVTAALYYAVMLAAFVIGLYGFFSLFWLATGQVGRSAQILSSLY
jgi:hypothetical protein